MPTTSQLTFTRFIAALMIVLFHFGREIFKIDNDFINTLRGNFNLGVSYFYVLSGFVMIIAYGNQTQINKKHYWINRISRIYPLHVFTLVLSILVYVLISINYLNDVKINITSLLFNLTLLHTWIPEYSLNYNVPSWSISVEVLFYFCFPFIYNFFVKKLKLKTLSIIFISFWILSQVIMNIYFKSENYGGYDSLDRYALYYLPISHLNTFLIGILFGIFYNKYKYAFNKNYDLIILVVFILTCIGVYLTKHFLVHNGLHALSFGFLILFITLNKGFITKLFNHKKLIYLGEISFAMYLLQNPIYILFKKIFKTIHFNEPYLSFIIPFIFLLIGSHFTYKYIEIPMKNRIKQKLNTIIK